MTARDELTERKLVNGWASAPGVRVRQATAADLPAVATLAALRFFIRESDQLFSRTRSLASLAPPGQACPRPEMRADGDLDH